MRGEKRREEKRREEDRREEKRREEKRIGEKRREQKRREETRRGEKRRGEERREERIGEEMEGCGGRVVREGWGEGWVDKETKKWDGVGVGPSQNTYARFFNSLNHNFCTTGTLLHPHISPWGLFVFCYWLVKRLFILSVRYLS